MLGFSGSCSQTRDRRAPRLLQEETFMSRCRLLEPSPRIHSGQWDPMEDPMVGVGGCAAGGRLAPGARHPLRWQSVPGRVCWGSRGRGSLPCGSVLHPGTAQKGVAAVTHGAQK